MRSLTYLFALTLFFTTSCNESPESSYDAASPEADSGQSDSGTGDSSMGDSGTRDSGTDGARDSTTADSGGDTGIDAGGSDTQPATGSCRSVSACIPQDGCCPSSCDGSKDDDCNAGRQVPVRPVGTRTIIVAQDGSGDETTIIAAVNAAKPGDTIQVKNGTYVGAITAKEDGTAEAPIALINYPSHTPIIKLSADVLPVPTDQLRLEGDWWLIEGFEIVNGHSGVKVYGDHITLRGNHIHHHAGQDILAVANSHFLVEDNHIDWSGRALVSTAGDGGGRCEGIVGDNISSPKHCHGIYFSGGHGSGLCGSDSTGVTIRRNILSNHAGRAIQWNWKDCVGSATGYVVENNLVLDSSWGFVMYHNVQDSLVRNNTFVIRSYPDTNDTGHYLMSMWGTTVKGNVIVNNIFHSMRTDVQALDVHNVEIGANNTLDFNLWSVATSRWTWGAARSDFDTAYASVSGWGANALCCQQDPGFSGGEDFHLEAGSPALGAGDGARCALSDFEDETRPANGSCDVGMDQRWP
ncbi:MAG: right-handed parallel beta-helix repeat-containing protein [Deltaproteobacteria bacterium]|nr:right-handed parallel beta-helix repeat-containing protein [Deltaproteobacteria bacterium]